MRKVWVRLYTGMVMKESIHVCRQLLVTDEYIEKNISTVMLCFVLLLYHQHFIDLMQDCSICIVNAMEILRFCTK